MTYIDKNGKHDMNYSEKIRKERQPEMRFNPQTRKYEVSGELKDKFDDIRQNLNEFRQARSNNKKVDRHYYFIKPEDK